MSKEQGKLTEGYRSLRPIGHALLLLTGTHVLPYVSIQYMYSSSMFFSAKGHIVLLLFSAGPLDITMAENYKVSAILHCFFPAQATGSALYNVITMKTNDSNPAGRLPFTWYSSQAQVGYHFYIVSLPLPFHSHLFMTGW